MKIGRNEKCFCGSNKKYKKCCLYKTPRLNSSIETSKNIDNKYENLFKLSQDLRIMIEEIMDKSFKVKDDKEVLTAFFLGKAYKTHGAILLLCKNGYAQDAEMLARTIFDMHITLLYILQDKTSERLTRYMSYDWFERKQSFDYIKSKPKLLAEAKAKYKTEIDFDKSLLEIETKGKEAHKKYDFKGSWSDKNIRDMSIEINKLDQYLTAYKGASKYIHTTARTMNTYMKREPYGHTVIVGQNSEGVDQALVLGFDCLLGIVASYIDIVDIEYVERLKVISDSFLNELHKFNTK